MHPFSFGIYQVFLFLEHHTPPFSPLLTSGSHEIMSNYLFVRSDCYA